MSRNPRVCSERLFSPAAGPTPSLRQAPSPPSPGPVAGQAGSVTRRSDEDFGAAQRLHPGRRGRLVFILFYSIFICFRLSIKIAVGLQARRGNTEIQGSLPLPSFLQARQQPTQGRGQSSGSKPPRPRQKPIPTPPDSAAPPCRFLPAPLPAPNPRSPGKR